MEDEVIKCKYCGKETYFDGSYYCDECVDEGRLTEEDLKEIKKQ